MTPPPLMPPEVARKLIANGCENWPRLVEAAAEIWDAPESTVTDLAACLKHRGLPREFGAIALSRRTRRLEKTLSLDPDEWRSSYAESLASRASGCGGYITARGMEGPSYLSRWPRPAVFPAAP
jgi:hypothetical protein